MADLLSTDPYITVHAGGIFIGQTEYLSCTQSPVWNATFTSLLFDKSEKLILKLFDKDQFNDDDFLGQVELELSSVPLLKGAERKFTLPVQQAGSEYKPKGTITFSVYLVVWNMCLFISICIGINCTIIVIINVIRKCQRN